MEQPNQHPLATRTLKGISSTVRRDWNGVPLEGIYLIESRPDRMPAPDRQARPPVVLTSAVFDPMHGEYSPRLLKLLIRKGFTQIFEAHYVQNERHGWLEPAAVIKDYQTICTSGDAAPIMVGFCGGAPYLMEALLGLAKTSRARFASGALLIAPSIPDHHNFLGWFTVFYLLHPLERSRKKCAAWTGHPYLMDNVRRYVDWYRTSELKRAMAATSANGKASSSFPIPVSTVYFDRDILLRRGRRKLLNIFSATEIKQRFRGWHGTLRLIPSSDPLIAEFCDSVCGEEFPPVDADADARCESLARA